MKCLLTIVRCLLRGHLWRNVVSTPWIEYRACDCCGRVESRRVQQTLVWPWRRAKCRLEIEGPDFATLAAKHRGMMTGPRDLSIREDHRGHY